MVIRVHDSLVGVAPRETLGVGLPIYIILSASILSEVCALRKCMRNDGARLRGDIHLMDEGATLRVSTGGGSLPKSATKVDMAEAFFRSAG